MLGQGGFHLLPAVHTALRAGPRFRSINGRTRTVSRLASHLLPIQSSLSFLNDVHKKT
jgi:hypothetical protein